MNVKVEDMDLITQSKWSVMYPDPSYVTLKLPDRGMGTAKTGQVTPHLFTPGETTDSKPRTRGHGGRGLGHISLMAKAANEDSLFKGRSSNHKSYARVEEYPTLR